MYEFVRYYKDIAKEINQEIIDDVNGTWYGPKGLPGGGDNPGHFDEGNMRFVNRNLNYFYIENMIIHALQNNYDYNPHYPKLLKFCNDMRETTGQPGPFGRMCIWRLRANCSILPHYDRWEYHHQITRFIFCVSDHGPNDATINIDGKEIPVEQGLYFNFFPALEKHSFSNKTDRDFYFIGYDYWKQENLKNLAINKSLTKDSTIPYESGYGGLKKITKYMSKE